MSLTNQHLGPEFATHRDVSSITPDWLPASSISAPIDLASPEEAHGGAHAVARGGPTPETVSTWAFKTPSQLVFEWLGLQG